MNIFVLDNSPEIAAQMHLDKHCVKMIVEYAQLLSTCHRLLDGTPTTFELPNGKKQVINLLEGEVARLRTQVEGGYMLLGTLEEVPLRKTHKYQIVKPICYSASHMNHPCAFWCRETDANYRWLYSLFYYSSMEYTHRYRKVHKTFTDLNEFLSHTPRNIPIGEQTPFAMAMGDEFKIENDPVTSYQNYYLGPKAKFARWTNRKPPAWFISGTRNYDGTVFERTTSLD